MQVQTQSPSRPDARQRPSARLGVVLLTLSALCAACGGGNPEPDAVARPAARSRPLAQAAPLPSATAVLDWAETAYASYFPTRQPNQQFGPYTYRYYPSTGNYLGVAGTGIWILGPVAGSAAEPVYVGEIAAYACRVDPASCTPNARPVARLADLPNVVVGTAALVDGGTSSDADGDPLSFSWSIDAKPAGSQASLAGESGVTASFLPDVPGVYKVSLVVSDGTQSSLPASIQIIANGTVTEIESNNDRSAATLARAGDTLTGKLAAVNDVDWFGVDVPRAGIATLEFDVAAYMTGVWNVVWYDPDLNVIFSRDVAVPGLSTQLPVTTPGRYYLRVAASIPALLNNGAYKASMKVRACTIGLSC